MGSGMYSFEAHQAITQTQAVLPTEKVFKQTKCHPTMDPKNVRFRESRDSEAHPESLGIIFALDVTGSMGHIPPLLAKEYMPLFMQALIDLEVKHPQVLFSAVGIAHGDQAPLQVGQFESEAGLINQWLTHMYLEHGGGGNTFAVDGCESYDLAMYFAARHTSMDCWEKRKHKGYFIMTGDERMYSSSERSIVSSLIGDQLNEDIPVRQVVGELRETFNPFFIIPDPQRAWRCERPWRDLLGENVIIANSAEDIVHIAAGLVGLTERKVSDLDDLGRRLTSLGLKKVQVHSIIRTLISYADTLGLSSSPEPVMEQVQVPRQRKVPYQYKL